VQDPLATVSENVKYVGFFSFSLTTLKLRHKFRSGGAGRITVRKKLKSECQTKKFTVL